MASASLQYLGALLCILHLHLAPSTLHLSSSKSGIASVLFRQLS
jgi:hypothetical protein